MFYCLIVNPQIFFDLMDAYNAREKEKMRRKKPKAGKKEDGSHSDSSSSSGEGSEGDEPPADLGARLPYVVCVLTVFQ